MAKIKKPKTEFNIEEAMRRITEKYCLLWLNRRTGDLVLSTWAYTMIYSKKRKATELDTTDGVRHSHRNLKIFMRTHAFVCEGWRVKDGK